MFSDSFRSILLAMVTATFGTIREDRSV